VSRWKGWFAFIFLGVLAWGTSFLWIKVALIEIGPFTMVMYRFVFGVATAWILVRASGTRLRLRGKLLAATLALGIVNTAIPITLISWAEIHIESGLAALLNSTMPLWTIVIAHFFLHDDRLTVAKAFGLVTGFAGVIVLISRDLGPHGFHGSLWGQLAVIVAAVCYACCTVFTARVLKGQHPLHTAAISLTSATVAWLIVAPAVEGFTLPRLPLTWLACVWMGVIGLALAYYAYFYLVNTWGATRSSLVTYVIPVSAVTLGIVFLGERPSWHVFAGGALIIAGIALVSLPGREPVLA